jgi:hypothetical protein
MRVQSDSVERFVGHLKQLTAAGPDLFTAAGATCPGRSRGSSIPADR